MALKIIVAKGSDLCIGKNDSDNDGLPWREKIPADRKHFRGLTYGQIVVMGRKTWELIGPLEGRRNIILTRGTNFITRGASVAHDPDNIRGLAKEMDKISKDVFIIGGAELYREFLPDAVRMYVTIVDGEFGGDYGDVYFPERNQLEWKEASREEVAKGDTTPYDLTFLTLDRITQLATS